MSDVVVLKWKLLNNLAQIPQAASSGAACFDLRAALMHDLEMEPGKIYAIETGLSVEIPAGYEMQVRARSGLALKQGLTLVNGIGTIDADYRGEIKVICTLLKNEKFVVRSGDRIAQALVAPVLRVLHEQVDTLAESERGTGGFGSTGLSA
jgi:dUTP pyrophosphatase